MSILSTHLSSIFIICQQSFFLTWSCWILQIISTFVKCSGCLTRTVTSASTGKLSKLKILRSHPTPTQSALWFNKPAMWSSCTLNFENSCSGHYSLVVILTNISDLFIPSSLSCGNFWYLKCSFSTYFQNVYSSFRNQDCSIFPSQNYFFFPPEYFRPFL